MKITNRLLAAMLLTFTMCTYSFAQDDTPVTNLEKINQAMSKISQKYLAYMSTKAHNNNKAKKAEAKRNELLDQIIESKADVMGIPPYKGDKTLKESTLAYLKLTNDVMNENYEKVVNLEEIAEQSYDNMEAYILMQKAINDKMTEAQDDQQKQVETYCQKYNINLIKDESEMSKKMKKMDDVTNYQNTIYLIFFKCSAQESTLMDAISKKNITSIEQIKSAMVKYADEGLAKLDTLKAYNGDMTLKSSCRSALEFFKREADKTAIVTDYYMKEESFTQIKKNFETNASAKSDKAEIDKYNKAVKEINDASKQYNQTNKALNETRDNVYKNWNNAVNTYMDRNIPYAD